MKKMRGTLGVSKKEKRIIKKDLKKKKKSDQRVTFHISKMFDI